MSAALLFVVSLGNTKKSELDNPRKWRKDRYNLHIYVKQRSYFQSLRHHAFVMRLLMIPTETDEFAHNIMLLL